MLLPAPAGARIIAAPSFDPSRHVTLDAPAGASIAEIVALALPCASSDLLANVRVAIGAEIIERERWETERPPAGDIVLIRVLPGNSGTLRTALSLAVTVAAFAAGQFWLGPALASSSLGASLGLTQATAASLASGLAIGASQALLNALVPLRSSSSTTSGDTSPSYAATGWRNTNNLGGFFPDVLGEIRFSPPYAALPYTEVVNGQTYLICAFLFGYGPLEIPEDQLRIGDTPISKYAEVELEIREGYADDEPITLYPQQVAQEDFNISLKKSYSDQFGAATRSTASDVAESEIVVTFTNGLFHMRTDVSGGKSTTYAKPFAVQFRISERKAGVDDWSEVEVWTVPDVRFSGFQASRRWPHPERGDWQVKCERLTPDWDDYSTGSQDQIVSAATWTTLRSFRPEYPFNFTHPMALVVARVRGTDQLNSVLDTLNGLVRRICWDWDAESGQWVKRATRNPASLYRYALQRSSALYPMEDEDIDLEWLETQFHPFCAANGLTYDRVHDFEQTEQEMYDDICAAGRALSRDDGAKWTGFIDRPQEIVYHHVSARNASEFSFERPYVIQPDAFGVDFLDSTNDYKAAKRIVPWPGFVGEPQNIESIELPGVTHPDNIWLEARKKQYEAIYRPDSITMMQDGEALMAARGDLCHVNYPLLHASNQSLRVKAVNGAAVVLDDRVEMEAGKSYAIRIRQLASVEGAEDQSILRSVMTVPGDQDAVIVTGSGTMPAPGDLIFFGEAEYVSERVLLHSAEGTDSLGARVTFIPYAPEIFTALAAEVPPPWNGRIGAEISAPSTAPGLPAIGLLRSGLEAGDEPPWQLFVPLTITVAGAKTARVEVQHRLLGASDWSDWASVITSPGNVLLDFDDLDQVQIRVRAIGAGVSPLASDWTAIVEHIVALNDQVERDYGDIDEAADIFDDYGAITSAVGQTADWGAIE
ncbi:MULTISPECIES: TipJ family phage tail tip protein [Methylosinus]|uniref:Phage tail protein n=1 Tax=Methylosinus trichosporium (strain ATCC 35070 / NCIMB 11131 / UNIQEM 75 / OB3b) TaxID=595536 RepID=A0A2D2CYC0_METT3|nr:MULTISPECIES: hypothetical protein [Methylosinus]ATQ67727.1 phage tail protein [Methylosinus trichosporium OB3b]OBS51165.1 hypothetical protein A8B73_17755 [Methylosinus sp. 3S-1]